MWDSPPVFFTFKIETMKISEIEIEDFASENTPDSPTWQGAVLGATWANERLETEIKKLTQANKALSLQNEILSGAYETSQRRVKELEAEKAELLELTKMLLQAESESGQGFCDCIDNDGKYYQSAHLAGILASMETIVEKHNQ